jgi:threonine 3-dehydrogenase
VPPAAEYARNGGQSPACGLFLPIPDQVAFEIAALTEPMTVSAEAVETAGVRPGDRVLVVGPGTIGQGIALFAEAAGAGQIVVVGKHDRPRLACLEDLGFAELVDLGDRTLDEGLESYLAEGRFDVVIEASGAAASVEQGLRVLNKRGALTTAGIYPQRVEIDLTRVVREHQQIRGSYRAPVSTWPKVIDYLVKNLGRVRHMLSHRIPLRDALAGFELARRKVASKVIILPQA